MTAVRPGRPRRPRRRIGLMALAGWLFADLLLVLALVSMSGQEDPLAAPEPTPTGPAEPTEEPTEPPEEPDIPRGVEQEPVMFDVEGRDTGWLREQIAAATEEWAGQEAAFVLTFGGTLNGTGYARLVNDQLHEARPDMFAEEITAEDFLQVNEPANTARLWVYFYTSPR
ncbi:hypothetical protein [Streptomyces johnsoniae]|uniref:Uncharacterized protein n=1 Tax=Streptomyces johnsoniae TaxID=3075532 RepID=A0ABU2S4T0_9ACTN|nr:hypothetical protein [Streptomyces sp. DSM 41886]MDT0443987.1 hypothetical protein [Streptomyces sp. DSM 41886]